MQTSSRIIRSNISILPRLILPKRSFQSTRAAMTVHIINSAEEFQEAIKNNKVVLVDSYADWCPPCKAIAPLVEKHSEEYKDVFFCKVDIDKCPTVAQELGVSSIPAFFVFKDGEKVDNFVGASPDKLKTLLKTYSGGEA